MSASPSSHPLEHDSHSRNTISMKLHLPSIDPEYCDEISAVNQNSSNHPQDNILLPTLQPSISSNLSDPWHYSPHPVNTHPVHSLPQLSKPTLPPLPQPYFAAPHDPPPFLPSPLHRTNTDNYEYSPPSVLLPVHTHSPPLVHPPPPPFDFNPRFQPLHKTTDPSNFTSERAYRHNTHPLPYLGPPRWIDDGYGSTAAHRGADSPFPFTGSSPYGTAPWSDTPTPPPKRHKADARPSSVDVFSHMLSQSVFKSWQDKERLSHSGYPHSRSPSPQMIPNPPEFVFSRTPPPFKPRTKPSPASVAYTSSLAATCKSESKSAVPLKPSPSTKEAPASSKFGVKNSGTAPSVPSSVTDFMRNRKQKANPSGKANEFRSYHDLILTTTVPAVQDSNVNAHGSDEVKPNSSGTPVVKSRLNGKLLILRPNVICECGAAQTDHLKQCDDCDEWFYYGCHKQTKQFYCDYCKTCRIPAKKITAKVAEQYFEPLALRLPSPPLLHVEYTEDNSDVVLPVETLSSPRQPSPVPSPVITLPIELPDASNGSNIDQVSFTPSHSPQSISPSSSRSLSPFISPAPSPSRLSPSRQYLSPSPTPQNCISPPPLLSSICLNPDDPPPLSARTPKSPNASSPSLIHSESESEYKPVNDQDKRASPTDALEDWEERSFSPSLTKKPWLDGWVEARAFALRYIREAKEYYACRGWKTAQIRQLPTQLMIRTPTKGKRPWRQAEMSLAVQFLQTADLVETSNSAGTVIKNPAHTVDDLIKIVQSVKMPPVQ